MEETTEVDGVPVKVVEVTGEPGDAYLCHPAMFHVQDLRSPPGNRLEALQGNDAGFHSIRVNNQWRIVFRWENNAAYEVTLIDYH